MTAPNIINVSSIKGKTTTATSTLTATTFIDNTINSSKVLKLNTLYVANTSTASATITVVHYSNVSLGLVVKYLARNIVVPAATTVLVLGRDGPIYLEEDQRISVYASITNVLDVVCSYEEIT